MVINLYKAFFVFQRGCSADPSIIYREQQKFLFHRLFESTPQKMYLERTPISVTAQISHASKR